MLHHNKNDKAVMSPLQRFRKKFISCAGSPISSSTQANPAYVSSNNLSYNQSGPIEQTRFIASMLDNKAAEIGSESQAKGHEPNGAVLTESSANSRKPEANHVNLQHQQLFENRSSRSVERDRSGYYNTAPLPKSPLLERKSDLNRSSTQEVCLIAKSSPPSRKFAPEEPLAVHKQTSTEELTSRSHSRSPKKHDSKGDAVLVEKIKKEPVTTASASMPMAGYDNFDKYLSQMVSTSGKKEAVDPAWVCKQFNSKIIPM